MPNLRIVRRGDTWQAFGTINGRRIRRSLGTGDAAKARELCALIEAKEWKRDSYGEQVVHSFEEAAVAYMKADGERTFLPPLIEHFRGRALGTIMPGELRDAARAIYPGCKASTWNRQAIVPARAVINHAAGLGWCAPMTVKAFPVERPRRRAADRAWIDAFMAAADADGLPRLSACALFMWSTGTRVGNAVSVLPEHVDLGNRTIVLPATKTDQWEVKHLTRELVLRLSALPMIAGKPIFGYADKAGPYHRMQAVCRRHGLTFIPPHQAGRHSYATNALAMGATVADVMKGGGWKTARMVLDIYAHAEEGGRAIAEIFDTSATQPVLVPGETKGKSRA